MVCPAAHATMRLGPASRGSVARFFRGSLPTMPELLASHASYLGIVVFLILTGCGLPIPEEVPIATAGILSARGAMGPGIALLACLVGALLGDCAMFAIGYHFGHNLLKDHPKLARFLHADREARFEQMIHQHGLKVLFVARFMVGVRSPVYLSAGILRIRFRRFLMMDLLCATTVVGIVFALAFFFGEPIVRMFRRAEIGLTATVAVAAAVFVGWLLYRRRKRSHALPPAPGPAVERTGLTDRRL